MAIYSLSVATPAQYSSSLSAAAWDAMAQATNRPAILEVVVQSPSLGGGFPAVGFGRSSNTPVQVGAIAPLSDSPDDPASVTRIATAWSTAPAAPTQFVRRAQLTNGFGSGVIWTFPRGFAIAAGTSAVVFALVGANASGAQISGNMTVNG